MCAIFRTVGEMFLNHLLLVSGIYELFFEDAHLKNNLRFQALCVLSRWYVTLQNHYITIMLSISGVIWVFSSLKESV